MTHDARPPSDTSDALAEWLQRELPGEPIDAARAARVKQRLLRRIADDQRERHLTVRSSDGAWRPFGPGLTVKLLHADGGIQSYLLRLAPGAELPPHRHPVDEECVVLEGELRIGELTVGPGGFHLGRKDVLHAPISTETGALIFLRGARPVPALLV